MSARSPLLSGVVALSLLGGWTDAGGAEPPRQQLVMDRPVTDEPIRALVKKLGDPNASVRQAALLALQKRGPAGVAAIPSVVKLFDPTNGYSSIDERVMALETLATMGPGARPALPAIYAVLHHGSPRVRSTARKVLRQLHADGLVEAYGAGVRREKAGKMTTFLTVGIGLNIAFWGGIYYFAARWGDAESGGNAAPIVGGVALGGLGLAAVGAAVGVPLWLNGRHHQRRIENQLRSSLLVLAPIGSGWGASWSGCF